MKRNSDSNMDDVESGAEEDTLTRTTEDMPVMSSAPLSIPTNTGNSQNSLLLNHPSGIVPTLQNVVSTVNLGCKLDLKEIALHARNAEYNPKVQPHWF